MTARDFIQALPGKVPVEALEGMETIFHFDLSGEGGGQQTVTLHDGQLKVQDGHVGDPKCTVRAAASDFVKVVTGQINPMMAMMTGKLKISDVGEMMRYAKMFGLG